jgi:hypothetical protein
MQGRCKCGRLYELDEKNFAGEAFDKINGKSMLFRCPECKDVNGYFCKTLEKAIKNAMRLTEERHDCGRTY